MSANDGGPAFPFVVHGSISEHQVHDPGMTLRDWFAGQAMAAMLRNVTHPDGFTSFAVKEERALRAYEEADAMLRARAEKGAGT